MRLNVLSPRVGSPCCPDNRVLPGRSNGYRPGDDRMLFPVVVKDDLALGDLRDEVVAPERATLLVLGRCIQVDSDVSTASAYLQPEDLRGIVCPPPIDLGAGQGWQSRPLSDPVSRQNVGAR
jgi:hypothetical protein